MKEIHSSLSEIALKLGVNKSKLAFFLSLNLIKPISKVGKTNIFDSKNVINTFNKITNFKKSGKTLKEIKGLLK